jgi:hypothetical protein
MGQMCTMVNKWYPVCGWLLDANMSDTLDGQTDKIRRANDNWCEKWDIYLCPVIIGVRNGT